MTNFWEPKVVECEVEVTAALYFELQRTILDQETDCWVFKGPVRSQMGYAQFGTKVGSRSQSGHREMYLLFNGAIPTGYDIAHL